MSGTLKALLFISVVAVFCDGKGAPWSSEETQIIYQKLKSFFLSPSKFINKYQKKYPDTPDFHSKTKPNAQKVRL